MFQTARLCQSENIDLLTDEFLHLKKRLHLLASFVQVNLSAGYRHGVEEELDRSTRLGPTTGLTRSAGSFCTSSLEGSDRRPEPMDHGAGNSVTASTSRKLVKHPNDTAPHGILQNMFPLSPFFSFCTSRILLSTRDIA